MLDFARPFVDSLAKKWYKVHLWHPNMSDGDVSCTAPAPAIVLETATKSTRSPTFQTEKDAVHCAPVRFALFSLQCFASVFLLQWFHIIKGPQ